MVDGQGYVRSSKEEMSQLAAELYAVVCVECQDTSVHLVTVINDLLTDTHSKVCALHVLLEWFFCVFVSCDYPYPSVPLAAYSPSCQWSGKPGNIREFDRCQGIDEKFRNVWGGNLVMGKLFIAHFMFGAIIVQALYCITLF